jgi:hypothetical protein
VGSAAAVWRRRWQRQRQRRRRQHHDGLMIFYVLGIFSLLSTHNRLHLLCHEKKEVSSSLGNKTVASSNIGLVFPALVLGFNFFIVDKPIGASPLTKCCFSHYIFWLRRILWGMGNGGLKKGVNAPRATESQRCKSSAS